VRRPADRVLALAVRVALYRRQAQAIPG